MQEMQQQQILRSADRINSYINKAEMALTELHKIFNKNTFTIVKRAVDRGEPLTDEAVTLKEYIESLSATIFWITLSIEFLKLYEQKSSFQTSVTSEEIEELKRLNNTKMLGHSYEEACDKLEWLRKVFIKLQLDFEEFCRAVGLM